MIIPDRYKHINFVPPASVAKEAEKGLEYRQKSGGKGGLTPQQAKKEGIGSGVQRAVNLKNRDQIAPKTIRRMKAFFDRHEKNKVINPEYKDEPWKDRGLVAWLLWGGDSGRIWVEKVIRQMDSVDKKVAKSVIASFLTKIYKGNSLWHMNTVVN